MTEGVLDIITACVVTHSDLGGSFHFSDCDLDLSMDAAGGTSSAEQGLL